MTEIVFILITLTLLELGIIESKKGKHIEAFLCFTVVIVMSLYYYSSIGITLRGITL